MSNKTPNIAISTPTSGLEEEERQLLNSVYNVPTDLPPPVRHSIFCVAKMNMMIERFWISPPQMFDGLLYTEERKKLMLLGLHYSPQYQHLVSKADIMEVLRNQEIKSSKHRGPLFDVYRFFLGNYGLISIVGIYATFAYVLKKERLANIVAGSMMGANLALTGYFSYWVRYCSPQVTAILQKYKFEDPDILRTYVQIAKHLHSLELRDDMFDNPQEIPADIAEMLVPVEQHLGVKRPAVSKPKPRA